MPKFRRASTLIRRASTLSLLFGATPKKETALRRRLARRVGKIDRLFLSSDGTRMWLTDQKVDIFFRIVYPIAYGVGLLALAAKVW